MPTRRYKRTIKSDVGQVKSSETTSDVSETPEPRKLEHDAAVTSHLSKFSVYSDAEYEMVETRTLSQRHRGNKNRPVRLSSSWKFEDTAFSKTHVSHRKSDRWCLLEQEKTRGYTTIVTQLRGAWDDQDLLRSKSFGKGRTVQFAEADTEWYAEQIAHSISGDAAELDVIWSFDPDGSMRWCGVVDTSFPEPDVMDWSEDWSNYGSPPCAENVFPQESQSLALISEDVSSPECVQQAELLAAEANRKLAQARSAVAAAKQNRSGFFPSSNVLPSRKGKGKGKLKRKSNLICGRSDHFWRQCSE